MSHSHDHTDDLDLSILEQMGYEERDLKIEKTVGLGIWFSTFVTVMIGVAWVVIWLMEPSLAGRPEKETGFRNMPGKDYPLLQSNATAHRDMIHLRETEKARMEGYGWTDETRTSAHIPLDRAMDLVLEEGLPVAPGARKMKQPAPDPVMSDPADMHEQEGGGHDSGEPSHEVITPGNAANPGSGDTGTEPHTPETRTPIVPAVGGAGGGH